MDGRHSAFGLLILYIFRYTDTHGMKIIPMTNVLFEVCCLSIRAIVEMDEQLPLFPYAQLRIRTPHFAQEHSTSQGEDPSVTLTIQPPFVIIPAL